MSVGKVINSMKLMEDHVMVSSCYFLYNFYLVTGNYRSLLQSLIFLDCNYT